MRHFTEDLQTVFTATLENISTHNYSHDSNSYHLEQ